MAMHSLQKFSPIALSSLHKSFQDPLEITVRIVSFNQNADAILAATLVILVAIVLRMYQMDATCLLKKSLLRVQETPKKSRDIVSTTTSHLGNWVSLHLGQPPADIERETTVLLAIMK
jgi:hypothetical protein